MKNINIKDMIFRIQSFLAILVLIITASLTAKAQTVLPPWEKSEGYSETIHNLFQIDGDNFDNNISGNSTNTWLTFGRIANSTLPTWTGSTWDFSSRRIGFISTEDTYFDWFPGENKREGSKSFNSMNFGFISTTNADKKSARSASTIMTITKEGRVGIGTQSPRQTLDVNGNIVTTWGEDGRIIGTQWDDGTKYSLGMMTFGKGRWTDIYSKAEDNQGGVTISTGSGKTERLRVTATGDVGIGTISPRQKLDVSGNIATEWEEGRFIGFPYKDGSQYSLGMRTVDLHTKRILDIYSKTADGTGAVTISTGATPTERLRINSTGKVLLIESDLSDKYNPSSLGRLSVNGDLTQHTFATRSDDKSAFTFTKPQNAGFGNAIESDFFAATGSTSTIYTSRFYTRVRADRKGIPYLDIHTSETTMPIQLEVGQKAVMQIFDGRVVIGDNLPEVNGSALLAPGVTLASYRLGVKGKIFAEGLTCKDLLTWADFVFEDNFKLMPLKEVAAYTAANKHLPGVPSEKEILENGIDVTSMLKIQMQKIEELTLHAIEQQKIIEKQQQQINAILAAKK